LYEEEGAIVGTGAAFEGMEKRLEKVLG